MRKIGLVFVSLVAFIMPAPAEAVDIDRVGEVHVHKTCGPVPWEAFQLAEYGVVKSSSTDVNASAKADMLKQSGDGSVGVSNDRYLDAAGTTVALPMTGEDWATMYATYMQCTLMTDTVEGMWRTGLSKKVIRNMNDVKEFMSAAEVLTNARAGEWWKEFQDLIDKKFADLSEEDKKQRAAIDALFAGMAKLREEHDQLFQKVERMEAEIQGLTAYIEALKQKPSAEDFADDIEQLQEKQETLEEKVEVIQEQIEDLATSM